MVELGDTRPFPQIVADHSTLFKWTIGRVDSAHQITCWPTRILIPSAIPEFINKWRKICDCYRWCSKTIFGCQAPIALTLTQTLVTLKRQCWHKNTQLYWKVRLYITAVGTGRTGENLPTRLWQKEKKNLINKKTFYLCPSQRFLDLPTALLYNLQHADCYLNLHYSVTGQTELENKKRLLWLGRDTRYFSLVKSNQAFLSTVLRTLNAKVFHQIMNTI